MRLRIQRVGNEKMVQLIKKETFKNLITVHTK